MYLFIALIVEKIWTLISNIPTKNVAKGPLRASPAGPWSICPPYLPRLPRGPGLQDPKNASLIAVCFSRLLAVNCSRPRVKWHFWAQAPEGLPAIRWTMQLVLRGPAGVLLATLLAVILFMIKQLNIHNYTDYHIYPSTKTKNSLPNLLL